MDIKQILYYAAEGTASEFEYQVKQIEKRAAQRSKNGQTAENEQGLWTTRDEKGRNVLFHAAITDNVKNFAFLMKKGQISKNDLLVTLDSNKATVLHWATQYSCTRVIKEIFQEKSEGDPVIHELILAKDFESVTPLHIAATKLDTKILKVGGVAQTKNYINLCSKMFIDALRSYPQINRLYDIVQDKRQRSPIHYAACKASLEAIRMLLDPNGPNLGFLVDQRDRTGVIPLMCAVGVNLKQSEDVIRLLIKKKPVSKTRQNKDGMTALHIAVAARNLDAVRLLIDLECSVDLVDNEQRTPLHYAAEHGYPEIVAYLLSQGARNSTRDIIGATPAHYAAQFSVDCLKIIFEESKITEVNDNENRSCLMWAVCSGNVDVINYLIQREDAPKRAACDKNGYTALHLAAMVGNETVCKILINQGWSLSERDNHSNTALHLASGRGHTDVLRCLVSCGANMNDADEIGRTPIFWACMGGQSHTLHCMIKELSFEWRTSGPTHTRPVTDNFQRTALHAAANAGSSACINVLLNIEQEDIFLSAPLVGWLDINGETALHEACLAGKFDCVLSLLKGGSGINAFGRLQRTPLDCAMNPADGTPNKIIVEHLRAENALTHAELKDTAARVVQRWWRPIYYSMMRRRERMRNYI
uniref:ANK_REP_REGION domain-containing protein n=1 Tax=Caenorhabditis tropicalis TaxID=1561998 RepID=A0A1I7U4F5_9PELO